MQLNFQALYKWATTALFLVACCFCFYLLRNEFSSLTRKLVYILGPLTIFLSTKSKENTINLQECLSFFKPWLPWFIAIILFICAHGLSGLSKHLHAYILFILLYFGLRHFSVKRSLVILVFALNTLILSLGSILSILYIGLEHGILGINKNVVIPELAAISVSLLVLYCTDRGEIQSKSLKWLILIAIISNVVAVVISEVRTALIVYLAAVPLVLFSANKSLLKKALPILLLCCICLIGLFFYTGRLQQGINDILLFQAGQSNSSLGIRFELWKLGLSAFVDHPIFGWGRLPFRQIIDAGYSFPINIVPSHFHNEMVNLLVTGGLVSFFGWLMTNVLLIKDAGKDLPRVALVISFFVIGLTENSWGGNNTAFYTLSVSWLLLYLSAPHRSSPHN